MNTLKYTTDGDGFALLETEEGFLQYFRGYRIQLSATAEGVGDNGSSYNINGHFSNVEVDCEDASKTKFVHLIALAHVYQAVQKYPNVLKQVKTDVGVFNQFMEHMLVDDFNQSTNVKFSLDDTVSEAEAVQLSAISELKEVEELEGVNKGSAQIYVGIKDTKAYAVDASTLKGHAVDFYEFATAVNGNPNDMQLTGSYIDFAKTITLNIAGFITEPGQLYPPHFYVNKKRGDSLKKSSLFSK